MRLFICFVAVMTLIGCSSEKKSNSNSLQGYRFPGNSSTGNTAWGDRDYTPYMLEYRDGMIDLVDSFEGFTGPLFSEKEIHLMTVFNLMSHEERVEATRSFIEKSADKMVTIAREIIAKYGHQIPGDYVNYLESLTQAALAALVNQAETVAQALVSFQEKHMSQFLAAIGNGNRGSSNVSKTNGLRGFGIPPNRSAGNTTWGDRDYTPHMTEYLDGMQELIDECFLDFGGVSTGIISEKEIRVLDVFSYMSHEERIEATKHLIARNAEKILTIINEIISTYGVLLPENIVEDLKNFIQADAATLAERAAESAEVFVSGLEQGLSVFSAAVGNV